MAHKKQAFLTRHNRARGPNLAMLGQLARFAIRMNIPAIWEFMANILSKMVIISTTRVDPFHTWLDYITVSSIQM